MIINLKKRTKMKKIILLVTMCVLTTVSFAQSGSCGANLTWTLSNGTLTISGSGTMTGYMMDGAPWAGASTKSLITKLVINGAESIGSWAFYWLPNLVEVSISESVTTIGTGAFNACQKLTSIVIPNNVTSLPGQAFGYCIKLNSVTLGSKVATIGTEAFSGCDAIRSVTCLYPEPQSGARAFGGVGNITLYVPAGSVEAYRGDTYWGGFKEVLPYTDVATETLPKESSICIYPNPVTESFRIGGLNLPAQVIISDMSGRTVWQQTVESNESVPAGNLSRGIYLVRVNGKILKIIKK
jgi:hypothetical protein